MHRLWENIRNTVPCLQHLGGIPGCLQRQRLPGVEELRAALVDVRSAGCSATSKIRSERVMAWKRWPEERWRNRPGRVFQWCKNSSQRSA
eukprot:8481049-Karenia_brevis.AAC.1